MRPHQDEPSNVPRRRFLKQACAAGAITSLGLTAVAQATRTNHLDENLFQSTEWQKLEGEKFLVRTVSNGLHKVQLVLKNSEVTDLSFDLDRPSELPRQSVSLLFEIEGPASLENQTHQLWHPALGEFSLMIHQIEMPSRRSKQQFEAVIN
ncbi:hypothetical protein [uncultured Gimesia sp.]|uniref:DUF6916 family protein n=1 Tax=uncultured Gimesia sp. TaxID=1678688 RepID=UPI0026249113|nr:hypothetical protein [uncultured Gimesia sp.]